MNRGLPISVLAILIGHGATTAWGLLLDPTQRPETSQPMDHWQVKTANGQVPQQNYTAIIVQGGGDILTGGPLAYGFPLSGITDISGPDWADIAAYLDSRAGLRALPTLVARYDNHGRPPLPAGVSPRGYRPDMVVLRPQSLWLLERSSGPGTGFTSLYQAALPEPGTFGLILLGGILLGRSGRRRGSF
jgi:hypothetical protein